MVDVHIWLRKREDMSDQSFLDYWRSTHAPIVKEGYRQLKSYRLSAVTGVPAGQERPYDGLAELSWEDREAFSSDMKGDGARRATEDLRNFTAAFGLLFVTTETVK